MPVEVRACEYLDLPGEIVSGHPDRHVARVEVDGHACYLKRQHRVGWRERLRNWRAGFGWVSKCEREAKLLAELEAAGFPHPECVAFGEDDRGRSFLLVAELAGVVELRQFLSDNPLSPELGRRVAELHAAGFTTPDLTAKHVFVGAARGFGLLPLPLRERAVRLCEPGEGSALQPFSMTVMVAGRGCGPDPSPGSQSLTALSRKGRGRKAPSQQPASTVTLIDWQSAERRRPTLAERVQCLAALHASVADATPRERLRFLREYLSVDPVAPFAEVVRRIECAAIKQAKRRSIRDQRQPTVTEQRLVWLAGEAVCAVPDVADVWPTPAITAPFYGGPFAPESSVELADGRTAVLLRQRSSALSRLVAKLRGRVWRSRGATLGRVLFHLERYGIPAPRLLAFGQRESSAESFVLFDPPRGTPLTEWRSHSNSAAVNSQVESLLHRLHDAGCRLADHADLFRVDDHGRVMIADPRAVRLDRKLSARARRADFARLLTTPG